MLRRVFDGLLIALVAWFALARLDAGGVVVGLALAAVLVFTGWRIVRLWRRYRYLLDRLAEAEALKLSDDPTDRQRAERILRERSVMQAAEMSIWTGFFLGAAAVDASHAAGHGGYEGIGADMSGGDFGGGFGGGGFDGGGGGV